MSPTTAMPWPRKSKAAESSTASTTTTSGPGTGKRAAFTPCSTANMAKASATEGQWMLPALRASSTKGRIRPVRLDLDAGEAADLADEDRERDADEEADQDRPRQEARQYAEPERPRQQAKRPDGQRQQRRYGDAVRAGGRCRTVASTAASTVIVAASGPTISFCDGPRSA